MSDQTVPMPTGFHRPVLTMPVAWVYDAAGRLLGGTPLDSERQADGGLRVTMGMFTAPVEGFRFCFSLREAMPHER